MKYKIVGIICALDVEFEKIANLLSNKITEQVMGKDFVVGDIADNKVVVTKNGIGKVNAGIITTLMIEHYNPDLIINSGIAGAVSTKVNKLDTVIATHTVYSDVDMTTDKTINVRYGQLQDLPFLYEASSNIITKLQELPLNFKYGVIMTGDEFCTNYSKVRNIIDNYFSDLNVLACDMESCAIAQTCYKFNVEFIIIRTISDIVGSSDPFDYLTCSKIASDSSSQVVELVIKNM